MIGPVLQACSPAEWAGGDWFRCAFDPVVNSVGEPLVGVMVGGVIVLSLYIAGDGMAAPAVVTILLSGALVPLLPGGMVGVAFGVAFVGLVAALISVGERYVLTGGVP